EKKEKKQEKKRLYHYYKRLRVYYRVTRRNYSRARKAWQDWKNRPPTPQQKKEAEDNFRLAIAQCNASVDSRSIPGSFRSLTDAAKALKRVRKLDPHVTLDIEEQDGVITYTHDYLAGRIMFLESLFHNAMAEQLSHDGDNLRRVKKEMRLAYKSSKQAL